MSEAKPRVMGAVFLTVLLDLIGFSVLFPLFPQLLEHYRIREGADSAIGELYAWLVEIVGDQDERSARYAVIALFGGVLGSAYSLLQFLFAPVWGGISDRIGRKRVLMVTLGGTVVAYTLWFFAGTFTLLVVSRLLAGIMAGNIATASAIVADVYPPEKRSRGMAAVGAAIGLGFVLGPALGAAAYALVDVLHHFPSWEAWGVNPFSSAAAVSLGLAALNWLLVAARLPETLDRGTERPRAGLLGFLKVKELGSAALVRTHLVYLAYMILFSAMEFTLVFLTTDRLSYEPTDNAWMFVFIGLVIALVQGGVVRRRAEKVGEKRMATLGLLLVIPGFVLVGVVPEGGGGSAGLQLYLGLFGLATGSAMVMPCLSALVSRYADEGRQGLAQGTFRSMGSLARALGPFLGGVAYWSLSSSSPYLVGALLMLVPLALAAGLPVPKPAAEEPA